MNFSHTALRAVLPLRLTLPVILTMLLVNGGNHLDGFAAFI